MTPEGYIKEAVKKVLRQYGAYLAHVRTEWHG
jgi:hypothetical protein